MSPAGALMAAEIAEQPAVLAGILDLGGSDIRRVAGAIRAAAPRFVLFAARGTSANAALYAKYLVEVTLGLPVGFASPAAVTVYAARPDLRDVLFVAVSQSGGSPDLIEALTTARRCGALTLAVTNAPASALAQAAELTLDVRAGAERAVAATKTYTAELLTLYLLIDALRGGDGRSAAGLPDATGAVVAASAQIETLVAPLESIDRLVLTARGYAFPTAREAALKLMETSYLAAQAFSGADLLHGPMAMVDTGSAVIAVMPHGIGSRAMVPVLTRLRERAAEVMVVGGSEEVAAMGGLGYVLPAGVPEEVSPVVEIVPLQILAARLAVLRGNDPDRPRGLRKVTQTW